MVSMALLSVPRTWQARPSFGADSLELKETCDLCFQVLVHVVRQIRGRFTRGMAADTSPESPLRNPFQGVV